MVQNVDKEVKRFCCFICLFGGFLICRFTSERRSSKELSFLSPPGCDCVAGDGDGGQRG